VAGYPLASFAPVYCQLALHLYCGRYCAAAPANGRPFHVKHCMGRWCCGGLGLTFRQPAVGAWLIRQSGWDLSAPFGGGEGIWSTQSPAYELRAGARWQELVQQVGCGAG
jgi:hypothetical protein